MLTSPRESAPPVGAYIREKAVLVLESMMNIRVLSMESVHFWVNIATWQIFPKRKRENSHEKYILVD
jgi:hypothetical protein